MVNTVPIKSVTNDASIKNDVPQATDNKLAPPDPKKVAPEKNAKHTSAPMKP